VAFGRIAILSLTPPFWRYACEVRGAAPAAWNEDDVIALFEKNPDTAGIAYPLRASNRQHMWAQFQDLEYLTAGYMKIAQVRGGYQR